MPDEIIRELYAAPPDRFTAAREKAASAAGDPKLAKAIKGLRKPTVAAWTVNLLAIRRPELIESLVELASSLRSAQRELRGDQLRKLAAERRKVIGSLVAQAQSLAAQEQAGAKVPAAEVESTLTAAMTDEQVAEQVRSGRLVRTTSAAGDFTIDVLAPPSKVTPSKAERPAKPRAVPAALRKELAAAEKAEEQARKELSAAESASREAAAELERVEHELEEIRQRRAEAEEDLNRRRHAQRFAQRALAAASRQVTEAQAAIADATAS